MFENAARHLGILSVFWILDYGDAVMAFDLPHAGGAVIEKSCEDHANHARAEVAGRGTK